MTDTTPDGPDVAPLPEEAGRHLPIWVIGAGIGVLLVGLVGGFFIGRGTKSSGPTSLADAIKQTESGSLPRGDITGVLQGGGGVRAILGTGGGSGLGGGGGGAAAGGGTGTGGGTGAGRGGAFAGTVSAVDGNVITVTTTSGKVDVVVSGSTTFSQTTPASITNVTAGERVTVRPDFTTPSTGGKVTAGSVIIVPAGSTTGAGTGAGT